MLVVLTMNATNVSNGIVCVKTNNPRTWFGRLSFPCGKAHRNSGSVDQI